MKGAEKDRTGKNKQKKYRYGRWAKNEHKVCQTKAKQTPTDIDYPI
jgi:hypothetical protein